MNYLRSLFSYNTVPNKEHDFENEKLIDELSLDNDNQDENKLFIKNKLNKHYDYCDRKEYFELKFKTNKYVPEIDIFDNYNDDGTVKYTVIKIDGIYYYYNFYNEVNNNQLFLDRFKITIRFYKKFEELWPSIEK